MTVLQPGDLLTAIRLPDTWAGASFSKLAGRLAISGAQPLRYNASKIPLMRNLVKRAIRGAPATGAVTT
jgi:hypothetical protein